MESKQRETVETKSEGLYDCGESKLADLSDKYSREEHRKTDNFEVLLDAIEDNKIADVRELVASGCPLATTDKNKTIVITALHKAAYHGQLDIVVFLVEECKMALNMRDRLGLTPLHKAAWQGKAKVCEFLLLRGADLWIQDNNSHTALQLAQKYGQAATADFLVAQITNSTIPEGLDESFMESGSIFENSIKQAIDLVGCRVSMYVRPPGKGMLAKKQWVNGTILRYDEYKVKHQIKYDDGSIKWVVFDARRFPNKNRLLQYCSKLSCDKLDPEDIVVAEEVQDISICAMAEIQKSA